jgi:hypothetical protein
MLGAIRSERGIPRALFLAILAGALFLRLLVPQGWMSVADGGGWRITICSGTGPVNMAMPAGMSHAMKGMHQGTSDRDHGAADHPCAFANLALALDTPPVPVVDLPKLSEAFGLSLIPAPVAIGRGLAAPPPPATGPPPIL